MQNNKNQNKQDYDDEEDSKIFPQKVMEMLSNEAYSDAICWLPHGKAFIIRNRDLFSENVMPKFFSRKAKYSSFMRKLKRWNFSRVSKGPEMGAYYNEFFCQDKPHLVAQMFCQNARTKLAMAVETNRPPQQQQQQQLAPVVVPQPLALPTITSTIDPSIMAVLGKVGGTNDSDDIECYNKKVAAPILGVSNLQLLERQIQYLQEEYAQQLYMQQMALAKEQMANNAVKQQQFQRQQQMLMQQQQQQFNVQTMMHMRQIMDLRTRQRLGLTPNNGRASAA